MKNTNNKPIPGKQYALTGATGTAAISNGNTWAESLVLACGHTDARPALSRYGHGDICSDCGLMEALGGDFISANKKN